MAKLRFGAHSGLAFFTGLHSIVGSGSASFFTLVNR
jgi:hypothetical protein